MSIVQAKKGKRNQELDSAFDRFHKQSFFVSEALDEFGFKMHVSGI